MLENFLNKISVPKFFKKKSASFLGVDLGSSSIKLVQLKQEKGVAVLETYGELSLGPYAGTEIGRATNLTNKQMSGALVNLIEEARVNVSECGVSIPLSSSLIFNMEVPKVSPEQLKKIVPIEARRYIPVSISEVMLDWRIIPERDFEEPSGDSDLEDRRSGADRPNQPADADLKNKRQNKIKIFVVAIHRNELDRYQAIVKNAQLNLNFLEIEIFSTIRSVVRQNVGTVAILDIGSGVTKLYIVEYGIVKDSHLISRGSQDISLAISRTLGIAIDKAEEKKRSVGLAGDEGENKGISEIVATNLKYIFSEAEKVLRKYQTEQHKNIDRLIFTGGGSVIKGLPTFASSILKMNTAVADPFDKIRTPAFLDDILKEIGPEFAVAVGLALRGLEK